MSVLGNFMKYEPMRVYAFSSITGSYTAVGASTSPSVNVYEVINSTDVMLRFSWNGSTDHFAIPAYTQKVIDINANKSQNHLFLGANEILYVKHEGAAPTLGNVYFITMYAGTKAS